METGLLQFLCNFGLGAVFAGIMFAIYRQLVKQMREDRKFMEDRQQNTINDYNKAITENTKILNELYTWLKGRNGSRA